MEHPIIQMTNLNNLLLLKKPKLYLYLAIAALAFSFLTWFHEIIGLAVAIPILILIHKELKNSPPEGANYSPEEIKYLK